MVRRPATRSATPGRLDAPHRDRVRPGRAGRLHDGHHHLRGRAGADLRPPSLAREARGEGLAWPAMVLVLAGLTGMCLTGDVFNLYVFLEISALSAYALLAIWGPGGARGHLPLSPDRSGGRRILSARRGVPLLLGGHPEHGGPGYAPARTGGVPGGGQAAIFMVAGLAVKMALFPFHFWLPDVYTNAPFGRGRAHRTGHDEGVGLRHHPALPGRLPARVLHRGAFPCPPRSDGSRRRASLRLGPGHRAAGLPADAGLFLGRADRPTSGSGSGWPTRSG
jgi:hypothetical protein